MHTVRNPVSVSDHSASLRAIRLRPGIPQMSIYFQTCHVLVVIPDGFTSLRPTSQARERHQHVFDFACFARAPERCPKSGKRPSRD